MFLSEDSVPIRHPESLLASPNPYLRLRIPICDPEPTLEAESVFSIPDCRQRTWPLLEVPFSFFRSIPAAQDWPRKWFVGTPPPRTRVSTSSLSLMPSSNASDQSENSSSPCARTSVTLTTCWAPAARKRAKRRRRTGAKYVTQSACVCDDGGGGARKF